jgi:hypothetical protein
MVPLPPEDEDEVPAKTITTSAPVKRASASVQTKGRAVQPAQSKATMPPRVTKPPMGASSSSLDRAHQQQNEPNARLPCRQTWPQSQLPKRLQCRPTTRPESWQEKSKRLQCPPSGRLPRTEAQNPAAREEARGRQHLTGSSSGSSSSSSSIPSFSKLVEACRSLSKLVEACRSLTELVRACRSLSKLVEAFRLLSKLVEACLSLSRFVQARRGLSKLVEAYRSLIIRPLLKLVQACFFAN